MSNKDKQAVKILNPQGIAYDDNLEIDGLSLIDYGISKSWNIDYFQQIVNHETGEPTQFLYTESAQPMKVVDAYPESPVQSTKIMGREKFKRAMSQIEIEKSKQSMLLWLGIFLLGLLVLIGLIVLNSIK